MTKSVTANRFFMERSPFKIVNVDKQTMDRKYYDS